MSAGASAAVVLAILLVHADLHAQAAGRITGGRPGEPRQLGVQLNVTR